MAGLDIPDIAAANAATAAALKGHGMLKGDKGDPGDNYVLTSADKEEIADLVLEEIPDVEVNPILEGTEPNLTGLEVNGVKYKVPNGGGAKSPLDDFIDNMDIDYAYDSATGANYTIIRVYKDKLDETKQYPFVYAPNGANACQKSTYEISKEDGWLLAINAGIFNTSTHKADGQLVENGVIYQSTSSATHPQCRPLVIDEDGDLSEAPYNTNVASLVANGAVSVVCGFMAIIKDWQKVPSSEWNDVVHYTQNAQRQIIGQFGNGDYAIITCEGRSTYNSDGWTIEEAQNICVKHGLKFAYNLDGGGSTELMLGLKHFNNIYEGETGRKVSTFIVFNGTNVFNRTPVQKTLQSISVAKAVVNYTVGATLDTSDISTVANYSDGSSQNVSNLAQINTNSVDMTTAGTYPINVSYSEGGITKTAIIQITVTAQPVELVSITATKTTTTYVEGSTLQTNDIAVMANWSNGSTSNVTQDADINTSQVNMNTAGTYSIGVSYTTNGVTKTATITIVVTGATSQTIVKKQRALMVRDTTTNEGVYTNYNKKRACMLTSTPNAAAVHYSNSETTIDGYLIPVPADATKAIINCPQLMAGPTFWNLSNDVIVRTLDCGWQTENLGSAEIDITAGQYDYFGCSFKNSTDTDIGSSIDTSGFSVSFA